MSLRKSSTQKKIENSFHGEISGLPDIGVDNFKKIDKKMYFLSHVHSDHYQGLFCSDTKINGDAKIFMSRESEIIIRRMHADNYNHVKDQIVVLDTDKDHALEIPGKLSFTVTLVPVQHMSGAVMFLFKTKDKTILYTGDFLIRPQDLRTLKSLHDTEDKPIHIDLMYYDQTFRDLPHLPDKELCYRELTDKIREWLDANDENAVGLFSYYKFGYEDVYKKLANELSMDIFCGNYMQVEALREIDSSIRVSNERSRIHVCSMQGNKFDLAHKSCGLGLTSYKFMRIVLSARSWVYNIGDSTIKMDKKYENQFNACSPTHSSSTQLDTFLNYFRPTEAIGFPDNCSNRHSPSKVEQVKKSLQF